MLAFISSKIQHLTRYFMIFAVIVFILYWMGAAKDTVLAFIGVPIYIGQGIRDALAKIIPRFSLQPMVQDFAILLPVTLVYYGLIGFQIKQLWNERGPARFITLTALFLFLGFIHFLAWRELQGFLASPQPL